MSERNGMSYNWSGYNRGTNISRLQLLNQKKRVIEMINFIINSGMLNYLHLCYRTRIKQINTSLKNDNNWIPSGKCYKLVEDSFTVVINKLHKRKIK